MLKIQSELIVRNTQLPRPSRSRVEGNVFDMFIANPGRYLTTCFIARGSGELFIFPLLRALGPESEWSSFFHLELGNFHVRSSAPQARADTGLAPGEPHNYDQHNNEKMKVGSDAGKLYFRCVPE